MKQKKGEKLRILGKVLFILYLCFLLYFLILSDWYGRAGVAAEYRYNLVLFQEIRRFWVHRAELGAFVVFANLLGNVLIFIPFGFLISMASKHKSFFRALFYSFGLSFTVEIFQLVSRVGIFDVDDLLLNTLGGVLGYTLFVMSHAIRRELCGSTRKRT